MAESPLKAGVLVIDDEPQIRRLLRTKLEGGGYRVFTEAGGEAGLASAVKNRPDVVVLDLGLPDMTGIEFLDRLREWSAVPVVVLSARVAEEDKLAAFKHGADDYVTKPFAMGEFLARLRAAQRHAVHTSDTPVFKSGPLEVDLGTRQVRVAGQRLRLTPTEYSLSRLFIRNPGRLLTHDEILREIWGPDKAGQIQYLRVYMRRLRKLIEAEPAKPTLLATELGTGYRLINLGPSNDTANRSDPPASLPPDKPIA